MMYDMNWGAGMMIAMSVISLIVVVGVIAGIVLLARALSGQNRPAPPDRGNALTILEERFARGDIDADDYESHRRLLGHDTASR